MTDTLYWLWLTMACGPGSGVWGRLCTVFGDAGQVFSADPNTIRVLIPRNKKAMAGLLDHRLDAVRRIEEYCLLHGIGIIGYDSELYPDSLRQIESPPPVIFVRGTLPDRERLHIGVVGTRRISETGALTCYSFSRSLANSGAVIVSGMALGADGIAHASALEAGMPTVAVVGCGLDCVYPPCHRRLFYEICEQGAAVSEYPPGEAPVTYHFPARNRIISALSSAVFVAEGAPDSGSMITAYQAFRQGKPVYIPTGSDGSGKENGVRLLLSDGARDVADASELLSDFFDTPPAADTPVSKEALDALTGRYGVCFASFDKATDRPKAEMPKAERPMSQKPVPRTDTDVLSRLDAFTISVYRAVPEYGSCRPEDIVNDEMPAGSVMRALTLLEFSHLIVRHPSGRISRI